MDELGCTMELRHLPTTQKYGLAAIKNKNNLEESSVGCNHQAAFYVQLNIKHECFLELRNSMWHITESDLREPLLGRSTLKALGVNTEDMIAAAMEQVGSSLNMAELLPQKRSGRWSDSSNCRITVELRRWKKWQTGMYSWRGARFRDRWSIWTGHKNWRSLQEAVENGISPNGKSTVQRILNDYQDVLRLLLGNDHPHVSHLWSWTYDLARTRQNPTHEDTQMRDESLWTDTLTI